MPLAVFFSQTPVLGAVSSDSLDVPDWAWVAFGGLVVFFLALDLGVHKRDETVLSFRKALAWSAGWISLAAVFGAGIWALAGVEMAGVFAAGYLLELSLSVDNLFVFLLVFTFFKIPEEQWHRVLFWGILGAVVMRAVFIFGGIALVSKFGFLMLFFGLFLVFTGARMLLPEKNEPDLERNLLVRVARRFFHVSPALDGKHFFTRANGRWLATPLLLVLLVIEGTDVVFAVDSIPAVIGILPREYNEEERLFLAFTSNIFAILGLRSLFFALSGLMRGFHLLKIGLAVILVFIGVKMLLAETGEFLGNFGLSAPVVHIPTGVSLAVVGGTLALAMLASILFPPKQFGAQHGEKE